MREKLEDTAVWSIPNILTLIRLGSTPIIIAVLIMYSTRQTGLLVTLALVMIGGALDKADGIIARKYNMETDVGKLLDPMVDKLWVHSIGITMLYLGMMPLIYVLIVVARDMVITNLRDRSNEKAEFLKADKLGKLKFRFQVLSVVTGIANQYFYTTQISGYVEMVFYTMMLISVYYTLGSLYYYLRKYT